MQTKEKKATPEAEEGKLPTIEVSSDSVKKYIFATPYEDGSRYKVVLPNGEKITMGVSNFTSIGWLVEYYPYIVEKAEAIKGLRFDCFFGKKGEDVAIDKEVLLANGLTEEQVYEFTYEYKLVAKAHYTYKNSIKTLITSNPQLKNL